MSPLQGPLWGGQSGVPAESRGIGETESLGQDRQPAAGPGEGAGEKSPPLLGLCSFMGIMSPGR